MNKIKSVIGVVLLFAVICGYAYEMRYFTNTFASSPLFFRGLVLGALVGLGVFFTYKSKVEDALERFQLAAFFILLGMLVFPFLSIWSNHFLPKRHPSVPASFFQREEPIRTGRFGIAKDKMPEIDGFYTYFLKNEALDRVRSKRQLFRGVAMGQEVELPIKHGFWGFDFVETE